MLKKLNLRGKIILMLLLISLITAGIVGTIAFTLGNKTLTEESYKKLTAIRELKAHQIENYFQLIFDQVLSFSESKTVIEAAVKFKNGFDMTGNELEYDTVEMKKIDSVVRAYYETQFLGHLLYRDSTIKYFSIPEKDLIEGQNLWLESIRDKKLAENEVIKFPRLAPDDFYGSIHLSGSSTVASLAKHIASLFQEEGASGRVNYESTGTSDGINDLIKESKSQVIGSSHPLSKKEINKFKNAGFEPLQFRIGTDALVVVVSNKNDFIDNITSDQLKQVFTSAVKWSDINSDWPDEIIQRFIPSEGSGSYNVFSDVILESDKEILKQIPNTTFINDGTGLEKEMTVNPYAVAFYSYNYYSWKSNQKILKINGLTLNNENIRNSAYPFIRPLYLVTTDQNIKNNPNVALLINYFLNTVKSEVGISYNKLTYWPQHSNHRILQYHYIANNPYPRGEKSNLISVQNGSYYDQIHQIYHPLFKNYLDLFGYYDIFLLDADSGHVIYSVSKEIDFSTDILHGPHKKSNLSTIFKKAAKSEDPNSIFFEDFAAYLPSYNAPASFIASPIYKGEQKIGVLVFQLPIDRINHIMTDGNEWEQVGLGKTGETYLVGDDFLMRNQSRFLVEDPENFFLALNKTSVSKETISKIKELNSVIGLQPVITSGTEAALRGETGTQNFMDYRNIRVLSAYKPLEIKEANWVIMSEIDMSEAFAATSIMFKRFITWFLVLMILVIILSVFFARSLAKPVQLLTQRASDLAKGNLDDPIILDQNDEIGVLAHNFEKMRQSIRNLVKDLQDINQNLEIKVDQRTEELNKAKDVAEDILNKSPVPVAVVDSDTASYIRVNHAMTEFHKLDANKLLKKSTLETYYDAERDRPVVLEMLRNNGKIDSLEVESRRIGTGEPRWTIISVHPISFLGKEVFITSLIDITERKNIEKQLKTHSAAMESAVNAIVITNQDGIIQWVNPAFTRLTGYLLDEVLGQPPNALKSGKHDKAFYKYMWDTILSGKVWQGEIINKKKNDELYYEEMTITPVFDNDERITHFVAIKHDISDRKKAEEAIKASENRFRSITSTASDAIISANDKGVIESWNIAAQEIFGYSEKEAEGQLLDIIIPEKYKKAHHEGMMRVIGGGEKHAIGKVVELEGQRKDGSIFPIELSLSTWEGKGGNNFSGIIRDITERKRIERALKKANERMKGELNVAKEIQMSMLPLIFPAFPKRSEIDLYAKLIPAREVGGDFYDFYFLDENHICFVVGDVSGKGVPAALMMAVTKTLLKSQAGNDKSTASILTHVNNEIAKDNDTYMFITVFMAILNTNTGELVYSNAGHNPSYVLSEEKSEILKLDDLHGPVIGAMEDMTYTETILHIYKDDLVMAYTDGVTESQNKNEELYSDDRFIELLKKENRSPKDLISKIIDSVKSFEGDAEQFDDITLLAIRYSQEPNTVSNDRTSIQIKNELKEITSIIEHFEEFGAANEIPFVIIQKFNIAFDELLNNNISYGFQDDREHFIHVDMELKGERLIITITDDGIPFNPFVKDPPDTMLSVKEREIGGLGIHIVKSIMDEYNYKRNADKNVITLIKHNIHK